MIYPMIDFELRHRLIELAEGIMNSDRRDTEKLGALCRTISKLLGVWTEQDVRILIYVDNQNEIIDSVKTSQQKITRRTKSLHSN